MIRHICMWILKDDLGGKTKEETAVEIKSRIEALIPKIDVIQELEVGININPNEPYNLVLNSVFKSMEDLKTYANHPDHVFEGKFIKGVAEVRSAIDYEF